ncbi:SDR family NAD(P)-dependent oxidoreductase [Shewanella sp. FJAT-52076]|uniref:SDR family NAD(P)-dependent oxidoreductase n=1 Tax=Shewanella sp. FJAT-52076 TaxID=2864202 RepID=UPI001C655DEB|nr:SDR family oxidoreductase [Shewanella sp. FJAT-52076]QYJ74123.1 SDR family oxidoreductase [Shewanella sp. FJAT-52076]
MQLKDKHILVTGASVDSDIGLAICVALASQGARLGLIGRRAEALEATLTHIHAMTPTQEADVVPAHYIHAIDLAELDTIVPTIKQLVTLHGPFDGLVHSASFQGYSPLKTLKPSQIGQYFDINFAAAAMLLSAFAKQQQANAGASLILIGSAAGQKGLKGRCLYAASKAALTSLVKSAALELADKHIRVNCVAPALVSGSKADKQFAMLGEQQAEALKAAHPLGIATPTDVADAVSFLLGPHSQKITGATLNVDGGFLAG